MKFSGYRVSPTRGFTLLELMVAISILAIASAAVFFSNSHLLTQQRSLELKQQASIVLTDAVDSQRASIDGDIESLDGNQVFDGEHTWVVKVVESKTTSGYLDVYDLRVFLIEETTEIGPVHQLTIFESDF